MRKSSKTLSIRKETLRELSGSLAQAAGGITGVCPTTTHGEDCFTTRTTIP